MNELTDENIELGIRRHTDDKLTYKLIIANAINECRRTEGHVVEYPNNVQALINIIYFKVKGYDFKQQIDDVKKKLDKEKEDFYNEIKEKTPKYIFYKRSYQAKFKYKLDREYWESFFKEIIQILASEGLLMDVEKYISIRSNE